MVTHKKPSSSLVGRLPVWPLLIGLLSILDSFLRTFDSKRILTRPKSPHLTVSDSLFWTLNFGALAGLFSAIVLL